jgi:hypothetical protein
MDNYIYSGLPSQHWLSHNWHNASIASYSSVTLNGKFIRLDHQEYRNMSDQIAYTSGPENDNTRQYEGQLLSLHQDDV